MPKDETDSKLKKALKNQKNIFFCLDQIIHTLTKKIT